MADGLKVSVDGAAALATGFKTVVQDMQQKTALRMVATAGGVLRKEAKRLATSHGLRRTGALINNIAIKREKRVAEGTVQYNLGVRHGREITRKGEKKLLLKVGRNGRIMRANDPFYWRFHEQGWIPRQPGQALTGGARKKIAKREELTAAGKKRAATPFIAPSLENKRAEAIAAMEKRLQAALDKANSK